MQHRLLGSLFRLRGLAQQFGHFWAYAVSPETITELFGTSASFADFQKKLGELCAELNEAPVGGRYLQDATFEGGWLTVSFGTHQQLRVAIDPDGLRVRAEYTNADRHTRAVYNDTTGDLTWESPPSTPRDAVRILKTIAILAECDPGYFVNAHLPESLRTEEARLYSDVPSWSYLWINPSDLKDILSAR